jgi:TatD-related deoxyribonuclease
MTPPGYPVTDDHIHIDPVNGRGIAAVKDFYRAGGTHMFLVTKPSWSYGVTPSGPEDFRTVYEQTLAVAKLSAEAGPAVHAILGVHPAEIGRLAERMPLANAAALMCGALDIAAEYIESGAAVALKSGRPHYPVDDEVMAASNDVLRHALLLARDLDCAVQLHAETGACADVAVIAGEIGIPLHHVVKHYGSAETPLTPSLIAREPAIPALAESGRLFTMESDYMDENSRPGAVMGPKAVPRATARLIASGGITAEDAFRIHAVAPEKIYGVEISW